MYVPLRTDPARHVPACSSVIHSIIYISNFVFIFFSDPNIGVTNITYNNEEFQKLPNWPEFTASSQRYLQFNELHEMAIGNNLRQMYCDFWDDPEEFTRKNPVASESSWTIWIAVIAVIILVAFLGCFIFRKFRRSNSGFQTVV